MTFASEVETCAVCGEEAAAGSLRICADCFEPAHDECLRECPACEDRLCPTDFGRGLACTRCTDRNTGGRALHRAAAQEF